MVPPAVLEVHARLKEAGHQSYLVGGCVRDTVLGRQPKDFDLATSARPEQVQALFKKVIPTGIQHGTVTVLTKGESVEVTTFRSEGKYVDGRRPETVEFHSDIEADLARRDFTINAMALDPLDGSIVDPFGGKGDLAARVVRCVRDAHERFSEDGLRALRAVRFATTLDFELDAATEAAIRPTLPVFRKLARERIRDELLKIIASPNVDRGVLLLERTGLLGEILPGVTRRPVAQLPEPAHRLAVLVEDAPDTVALLKLPSHETLRVTTVAKNLRLAPTQPVALRQWASKIGREFADDVLAIDGRPGVSGPLTIKELAIDGATLLRTLKLPPGPAIGAAQRYLLERILERPELNTRDQLQALLEAWRP